MTATLIDWKKICDLTEWDEKPFTFQILIENILETVRVCKKRYVMVIFNEEKSISPNLNSRNPYTKFDRAAYIDPDGWLWVGNIYEG